MAVTTKDFLLESIRNGAELTSKQQFRLTMLLCGPAIVAQLASVMLQFIDAAMVGSLGANPAASIGLIATTTWLFGGFQFAACQGFSVQVAHLVGANDFKAARAVLRQSITACMGMSLLLALAGVCISGSLPLWLGGSEEIVQDASRYFFIYSLSLPFMQMMWLGGTMLQCSGNMKLPSIMDVVMCVLDVVLNFFLIFPTREISVLGLRLTVPGAGLGVAGAALGTGLAMAISALLMCWFTLVKSPILAIVREKGSFRLTRGCLKNALGITGPMWLQNVAMRGAHIAGTIIVAPLGPVALAANNFAITVEGFCYMPGYGMADAATTLVGQSLGAAREKLARSFSRITLLSGMTMMMRYPRAAATEASPMPVLPEVGSMMTEPGPSRPRASASSIMALAMRSLTLPAGLKYSSLARILACRPSAASIWVSSSRGVRPIS